MWSNTHIGCLYVLALGMPYSINHLYNCLRVEPPWLPFHVAGHYNNCRIPSHPQPRLMVVRCCPLVFVASGPHQVHFCQWAKPCHCLLLAALATTEIPTDAGASLTSVFLIAPWQMKRTLDVCNRHLCNTILWLVTCPHIKYLFQHVYFSHRESSRQRER